MMDLEIQASEEFWISGNCQVIHLRIQTSQTDGTTLAFKALKPPRVLWEKNSLEIPWGNFNIRNPLLGKSHSGQDEYVGYHCLPL